MIKIPFPKMTMGNFFDLVVNVLVLGVFLNGTSPCSPSSCPWRTLCSAASAAARLAPTDCVRGRFSLPNPSGGKHTDQMDVWVQGGKHGASFPSVYAYTYI